MARFEELFGEFELPEELRKKFYLTYNITPKSEFNVDYVRDLIFKMSFSFQTNVDERTEIFWEYTGYLVGLMDFHPDMLLKADVKYMKIILEILLSNERFHKPVRKAALDWARKVNNKAVWSKLGAEEKRNYRALAPII